MSEADYDSWTKEELISRLVQLESHGSSKPSSKGKGRAQAESIDWANAPRRKIALKFCYGGWDYGGLAIQKDRTPLPTVEGKLFGALVGARLVDPKGGLEGCGWERCGRTDRGVSAAGQVISLWVRSALSQEELTPAVPPPIESAPPEPTPQSTSADASEDDFLPGLDTEDIGTLAHPPAKATPTEEHPFTYMINRHLPDTIKILAWSPVDASFSSRYSCTWRHYKYFFSPVGLDVAAMRAACVYLPGTHDFRNLCKIDPTKQLDQFRRDILHASISPVDGSNPGGMHVFDLKGSSFLYHMVRNIMGVLLSIGARLEPPTLLPALMNVAPGVEPTTGPPPAEPLPVVECRPEYMMADALPLTLWDCGYPEGAVNWQPETRDPHSMVYRALDSTAERSLIQTTLWQHFVDAGRLLSHGPEPNQTVLSPAASTLAAEDAALSAPRNVFIPLGGGTHRKMMSAKYVPVLQRNRLEHFEVQNARWREKARQKGLKIPDHAPEDAEE
ncbi:pseudouridine synthase [Schizophyllum commune]